MLEKFDNVQAEYKATEHCSAEGHSADDQGNEQICPNFRKNKASLLTLYTIMQQH